MSQGVTFGSIHDLAAFPRFRLDQRLDFLFDACAQDVRIECIDLPTSLAVVFYKPLEARIFALVGSREGWQTAQLILHKGDPFNLDVIAFVFFQPVGEIPLGHIKAARIPIADIQSNQRAAVVVFRYVMSNGRGAETVHDPEADTVLVKYRCKDAA